MPAGLQSLGIYSDELRTGIKRKAQTHTSHNMPRSQYEIYHFASKYDLPEAAVWALGWSSGWEMWMEDSVSIDKYHLVQFNT